RRGWNFEWSYLQVVVLIAGFPIAIGVAPADQKGYWWLAYLCFVGYFGYQQGKVDGRSELQARLDMLGEGLTEAEQELKKLRQRKMKAAAKHTSSKSTDDLSKG